MNGPLEREHGFFLRNRDEFVRRYDGKFIAIKDEEVLGVFSDYLEAAEAVYPEHEYGTVFMQPVHKEEPAKIITVPTAVIE